MKTNFLKYFTFMFSAILTFSCSDFLSEDAAGRIDSNYALTEEGAEKELLSLYQINADLLEHMYMVAELGNDLMLAGGNTRDYWKGLIRFEDVYLLSDGNTTNYWKWLYVGVVNANIAIHSISNAAMSTETKREQLLSEAHALRAFYNFLLVETYGPAAHLSTEVIESPEDVTVNQPGIAAFYKNIFEDLDIADTHLKEPSEVRTSEFGRMDAGIAKMIRLRAYMSLAAYDEAIITAAGVQGKTQCYQEAVSLSESLIRDYGYSLQTEYKSIFDTGHEQNSEIIWSIQYNNSIYSSNNNHIHRYWTPYYNTAINGGNPIDISGLPSHSIYYGREYRSVLPTLYFIQVFDKTDKRREATFDWAWCRIDNTNDPDGATPVWSDTLMIRSLDILPAGTKENYRSRGIACDDISDIYDPATGIPLSANARSRYNSLRKWQDISRLSAKQEYAFRDAILMRLGEVYITQAEAYIQLGEKNKAAEVIRELRQRATTPGYEDALAITGADMDIPFILDEGVREMGGEIYRWYMLKRALQPEEWVEWIKKRNVDACELVTDVAGIKKYHYFRPVPQETIDDYTALGLEFIQNDGY